MYERVLFDSNSMFDDALSKLKTGSWKLAEPSASGDTFYLDTRNMDAIIDQIQKIAQMMETVKQNYRQEVMTLTQDWKGDSRNMFDRRSEQLLRKLTDISQSFFEIGEELLNASESYMQADTDLAKSLDGVQTRY